MSSWVLLAKRIKWILVGFLHQGFRDFRCYGLMAVLHFSNPHCMININGWVHSFVELKGSFRVAVFDGSKELFSAPLDLGKCVEANNYLGITDIGATGFTTVLEYQSGKELQVCLVADTVRGVKFAPMGIVTPNCGDTSVVKVWNPWEAGQVGCIDDGYQSRQNDSFAPDVSSREIDVIVPVFNGFDYLADLFTSIDKTSICHRVIIIDDCSTDERVLALLENYCHQSPNRVLLKNSQNLGFVQTVNRGLAYSENDVVLLNTDIELPQSWLERLLVPSVVDDRVASVTPFTNSGTICSFPLFLKDNPLPEGFSLAQIDDCFAEMKPRFTEIPTAVGFCMYMSRAAIRDVGLLDADAYDRGYGEENDWCQAAIKLGYKNVMVENLFVYHKHGGTFVSEEKRTLMEKHAKLLSARYPNYNADVARFCSRDSLKEFRSYIHARLSVSNTSPTVLVFNHLLGGGASAFLDEKVEELLCSGFSVATVYFSNLEELYRVQIRTADTESQFSSSTLKGVLSVFDSINQLWINELASYRNLPEILEILADYVAQVKCKTRVFIHDYLPLCPSLNLINDFDVFCGLPVDRCVCEKCYRNSTLAHASGAESLARYRKSWLKVLSRADELVVFSESSRKMVMSAYPNLDNVNVKPHLLKRLPPFARKLYNHEELHVGLLGMLTIIKGRQILEGLIEYADQSNDAVQFSLIGETDVRITSRRFKCSGGYSRDNLPGLIETYEIDVFLLPSICPETFSFTCEEVIEMGYPLVVFDLGAQAEKVKEYEKGLVVPLGLSPDQLLSEIKAFANSQRLS